MPRGGKNLLPLRWKVPQTSPYLSPWPRKPLLCYPERPSLSHTERLCWSAHRPLGLSRCREACPKESLAGLCPLRPHKVEEFSLRSLQATSLPPNGGLEEHYWVHAPPPSGSGQLGHWWDPAPHLSRGRQCAPWARQAERQARPVKTHVGWQPGWAYLQGFRKWRMRTQGREGRPERARGRPRGGHGSS